jgi:hypothetical protein
MRQPNASVILLEFNELTPTLVHRFMREGKLPHFKRFYEQSGAYVTEAQESQDKLEPWIQWVTVHTGLSFAEHGVFTLGEGHKLQSKCIWDLVSDAGWPVWVCGSMNTRYDLPLNGAVLPDPWSTYTAPQPEALLPYCRFVQRNVQEHTNDRVPLSAADYFGFLRFMVSHGLSTPTIRAIVQQLIRERRGKSRWKRAVLLDKLQWDVFRHYYEKMRPALATYFLNSTAHLQHMYWRSMEPKAFRIQPTAAEQAEYGNAILYGYQEMDDILGRFLQLADERTTLVLCTALSQQPCLIYQAEGVKSGMHNGDGFLWIRSPARTHHVAEGKVPLRSVAPTILTMLGLAPPSFMRAELLPLLGLVSRPPARARRSVSASPTSRSAL